MRQAAGTEPDGTQAPPRHTAMPRRLSTRLVWITMISIFLAEVLIFVPSIAKFRQDWLGAKVESVAVASFASGQGNGTGDPMLSAEREAELLRALDAQLIAVEGDGASRLLARLPEVSTVQKDVALDATSPPASVLAAFATLMGDGSQILRVHGPIGDGSMRAELVTSERALRAAMLEFAWEFFLISLIIAVFAGLFLNLAIDRILVRPIRQMTQSMISFGAMPEDPERIIEASTRDDELGLAERELARMQGTLAQTLRERRHLADLGLAVSKINHDLRNTLASAQLVSDRLSDIPDPDVQRFAPTLLRSLDRALAYTQSVLAYGKASEALPVKRKLRFAELVDEILDTARLRATSRIELVNAVPAGMEIEIDAEQFQRALSNLVRNSLEALESDDTQALVRRVTVSAERTGNSVLIAVEDTGPGLSGPAKTGLFQAFRGSTRLGGTGLGLAIAAEIVEAHGGRIRHCDGPSPGARFEIELPGRPVNGNGAARNGAREIATVVRNSWSGVPSRAAEPAGAAAKTDI